MPLPDQSGSSGKGAVFISPGASGNAANPGPVNPAIRSIRKQSKRSLPSIDELKAGILASDRVMLARAITLVESTKESDREIADRLISEIMPSTAGTGKLRLGITGIPGVGKSTFIESFGNLLIDAGHRVAVLAVDPSSEKTGGSILGDKTRMESLTRRQEAFVRPSPSAGTAGGVARKTRETVLLCEAAGFDRIIIETVGVGQGETVVASMVDFFLLLMLPGAGDELQGMKRGIMEMADAIVITKSDGDNMRKAKVARADYNRALHLLPLPDSGWKPEVILSSALTGLGLEEVREMLEDYLNEMTQSGYLSQMRKKQAVQWMNEHILEQLQQSFQSNEKVKGMRKSLMDDVEKGKMSPFTAARKLVQDYFQSLL